MIAYVKQMDELFQDKDAIQKFHSLRAPNGSMITPWVMQVSLRMDDLWTLLKTLSGCKIWNILGASVKPHTLNHSPQGLKLQQMMGKGKSSGKGKSKK